MDGTYENWVAPASADGVKLRGHRWSEIYWRRRDRTDIGSADTAAFNLDVDVAVALLLGGVVNNLKLMPFLGVLHAILQISPAA